LNKRIFSFELNKKPVLGFDTGLDARSFAQSKMAQFITQPGFIAYPNAKLETWQPGGVAEQETMIIWGPPFSGEGLEELINARGRQDEALAAFRFWLMARTLLEKENKGSFPFPGPAGAYIVSGRTVSGENPYPEGTVFFPPGRLLRRTIEAEGSLLDAECWVHPDLEGARGISFCSGAMLYGIFCGTPPFMRDNPDELRQDIREAVFIPPGLAAPGLESEMSSLIIRAMTADRSEAPTPDFIRGFVGSSKPVSSWVKPLSENEIAKIRLEQDHYGKKKTLAVKRRRFVVRNSAIITGSLIAIIVLALFVRSMIRSQAEKPTTLGMSPMEVAEAYYGAFGDLDHMMMEACVTGKTGKADIDTVINFFVVGRVRQAYERFGEPFMPVRKWFEEGCPATEMIIFGITDLKISVLSEGAENASLEANYVLWAPGAARTQTQEEDTRFTAPGNLISKDVLYLVFKKGVWRITNIDRTSYSANP
jgi:hypothetical protein